VLDRPNPLGGVLVEGNHVGASFRSFVGLYDVPARHGMTAGELARLLDAEQRWGVDLTVVPCQGWTRAMAHGDTGLPFIPPSPNMPTVDTALVYPGMCLLEGTNLSEGRGTCRPFEQFGAPWLDADALAEALLALELPGLAVRPVHFTPTFDKHRGASCAGAFLHVVDARAFRPVRTGLAAVVTARALSRGAFAWRADAYEFVSDRSAFDLLCGTDAVRLQLEAGAPFAEVAQLLDDGAVAFQERRRPYLLYA
jgi:uncharacterized protein YbbC (DUF1343 family)